MQLEKAIENYFKEYDYMEKEDFEMIKAIITTKKAGRPKTKKTK